VHSAKGLEFGVVFITGLEEGLFPHENAASEPEGIEEVRRLMYVAITRARRRLYLSFSQTRMLHGQTRYNMRSRFFDELPPESLKWLTPRTMAYGGFAAGGRGASAAGRGGWNDFGGDGRRLGGWRDEARASSGAGGESFAGRRGYANGDHGRLSQAEQRAALRFDRGVPWRVGQSVAHARFGEGVIVGIEGSGDDARVQIDFGRQGTKWLALSVAKLEPVA
ncbi:MAG: ATP-binding domain-containing protein, partial [Limnobacter sp.]|nr:ATP-binding domain-containing protein [Limnobacter sp.]